SRTIAKAMSAYDKDFSDAIYGMEDDGRYVTESRLKKMLTHEINLIEKRLSRDKHPNKLFFSFANTVATIDFAKQFKGHGWLVLNIKSSLTKSTTKSYYTFALKKMIRDYNKRLWVSWV